MNEETPPQLPGLTQVELETLKKTFSSPLDVPPEWKAWLISYLEANPPAFLFPTAGSVFPTGAVMQFAAAAPPAGWVLCDGASLDRINYAALFGVIGTLYGSVDGTHFNVPDFRGRTVVGKGTNVANDVLGENDGVAEANRRGTKHRHTPHSHTHLVDATGIAGTAVASGDGSTHNGTATFGPNDGGSGNANDPLDGGAFLVLNFIIKT